LGIDVSFLFLKPGNRSRDDLRGKFLWHLRLCLDL
jgi:hypothetical protein